MLWCLRKTDHCPHRSGRPGSIGDELSRHGITALDRSLHLRSALSGVQRLVGLDGSDFGGKFLVVDRITDPAGIIAAAQVIKPSILVDSLGKLQKQNQILSAKI